jgi:rfaE bifunctional protein nucleotidyltransferase chain/domain
MSEIAGKWCPTASLGQRIAALPRPLVMTNGVFDVLHRGHVSYLEQARAMGASLVVALNSDASARGLGKGPDRPLNREMDRAFVLAGLSSVSLVTLFDTPTPVPLLPLIHPDVYVKGGDYDMDKLEEARVVRSWGGRALSIPFVDGFSTTALVHRIRHRPAVFLDRDGVINDDRGYVHRWEDLVLLPGVPDAMRRLKQAGYQLVVVTNQSGIARGYYSQEQYQTLTDQLIQVLAKADAAPDLVLHCPHHPDGQIPSLSLVCDCRKPQPGMLRQAEQRLGLDMARSVMIGDRATDLLAGQAAGVGQLFLVGSNAQQEARLLENVPHRSADHLAACVDQILALRNTSSGI